MAAAPDILCSYDAMADYTAAQRAWLSADPIPAGLAADPRLESLMINASSLERFEIPQDGGRFDLNTPGTLGFDVECHFKTRGVMFSCGKAFKRSHYDPADNSVFMAVQFLPRAAGSAAAPDVAAPGVVSVCLDEALGGVSFAGGGGFTATLEVEHHTPAPLGETLIVRGRMLEHHTTDKGTAKFLVEGVLHSADGSVSYSSAKGLFIRPANGAFPTERYSLFEPEMMGDPERRATEMERILESSDPATLEEQGALRVNARRLLGSSEDGALCTHLPDFEGRYREWLRSAGLIASLQADAAARNWDERGGSLTSEGGDHLLGKVFLTSYFCRAASQAHGAAQFRKYTRSLLLLVYGCILTDCLWF